MRFTSVSILGAEMPLLRKCLPEMIMTSKSHDKENAVLSSRWCCSAPGNREEEQTVPLVFPPCGSRAKTGPAENLCQSQETRPCSNMQGCRRCPRGSTPANAGPVKGTQLARFNSFFFFLF